MCGIHTKKRNEVEKGLQFNVLMKLKVGERIATIASIFLKVWGGRGESSACDVYNSMSYLNEIESGGKNRHNRFNISESLGGRGELSACAVFSKRMLQAI